MKKAPRNREILIYKYNRWNIASWWKKDEGDGPAGFYDRDGFDMNDGKAWADLPTFKSKMPSK